VAMIDRLFYLS